MMFTRVCGFRNLGYKEDVMTKYDRQEREALLREDGKSAANALPFDREQSAIAFETATFGLG